MAAIRLPFALSALSSARAYFSIVSFRFLLIFAVVFVVLVLLSFKYSLPLELCPFTCSFIFIWLLFPKEDAVPTPGLFFMCGEGWGETGWCGAGVWF